MSSIGNESRVLVLEAINAFFAAIGLIVTLYIFFSYESWVHRQGILAHLEIFNFKILLHFLLKGN